MQTLITIATWVAIIVVFSFFSRLAGKRFGSRSRERPSPPSLSEILSGDADPEAYTGPRVFRRRHFIQTAVFVLLGGAILLSFFASLASGGWGILTLLLVVAEIVLIFAHGTPLLFSMSRTLTISDDGISARELFSRRSINWWEVHAFQAADDLSRFRAEGLHTRLTYETSAFPPDTKRTIYRTLRAHLDKHQVRLKAWNQGPPILRFARGHAVGLVFLGVLIAGAVVAGSELDVEDPVLGFRCATASEYLRERHGLPGASGCVILRVNVETDAYKAGLRQGDMVVALENTPVTSEEQLTRYFQSLKKKGDDFSVIKAGETGPRHIRARPGSPGRLPETDGDEVYTSYLRGADGGFPDRDAIVEYTKAIDMAPEFDMAYVQRGVAYAEEYAYDRASADLTRAIELDPGLAEAYRERAVLNLYRDNESTLSDVQKALELDRCATAFKSYNYDCYSNHLLAANAYGGSGETEDYARAAEEAVEAISFYPEMANAYYLAAYYLWNGGREDEARDYAAQYLEAAEGSDEPGWYTEWARYVVSGTSAYAEARDRYEDYRESTPAEAFLTESLEDDILPDGPARVTSVTFAEERTIFGEPPGQLTVTFDRPRVWAYFKFDNALYVKDLTWSWSQNGIAYGSGNQKWPGLNKGEGWIQLENQLPSEPSQNVLTIWFDGEEVGTATLHIGDDAYVGPLRFYSDAEASRKVLFYDGQATPVYATAQYASLPPGTELTWTAERAGVRLASGTFQASETAQTVFQIALSEGLGPGVIDVYVFLGNAVARHGVLVVSPTNAIVPPPFASFSFGTYLDEEEGISPTEAKEFSVNEGAPLYAIEGANLGPGSVLSIRWMLEGSPMGPAPDEVRAGDLYNGYYEGYASSYSDSPAAGEYEVIVSLDGQAVYGDIIVLQ